MTDVLKFTEPGWTATVKEPRVDLPNIAFIGKAGSGKSTAAQYLVDNYGYERLSFAALLKEIAVSLWGPAAFMDRDKLQKLGVKVREIDEDAWVNVILRHLDDYPGPFVIDDCRFPNEYWALRGRGFKIVRIRADESDRVARLTSIGKFTSPDQLEHISETALDGFAQDNIIYNYTYPETFLADVQSLLDTYRRRAA